MHVGTPVLTPYTAPCQCPQAVYPGKQTHSTHFAPPADKAAEVACIKAIQAAFPDHAILGEEGGILGDTSSDYLW